MTDERKALREAAEKVVKHEKLYGNEDPISVDNAETILSLLDALAASEAKLEKAREALRPFVVYVHDDVRNSTDAFKLIRSRENGGGKLFAENFRLAATTLKEITEP